MNKLLFFLLLIILAVVCYEILWISKNNNTVQTAQTHQVTQKTDLFKQQNWQVTPITTYPSTEKGKTSVGIGKVMSVEKNNTLLIIRFADQKNYQFKIDYSTRFFLRRIPQNGYSTTQALPEPFPVEKGMMLLVTWQNSSVENQVITLKTITKKI